MKWQVWASITVASLVGAVSVIYVLALSDQSTTYYYYTPVVIWFGQHGGGSEILLLILGSMFSMRHEDFPIVASVFVCLQVLVGFLLSLGLFSRASRDGRMTVKGVLSSPFFYLLAIYIVIMFFTPAVQIHM